MEISLPTSGVFQFSPPPAVKTVSTDPTPTTTPQAAATQEIPAVAASGTSAETAVPTPNQDSAAEAAKQAALSFKNTYAVSDSASSTYKDANGTLITITRDYRSGKVSYSPEPAYVKSPQSGVSFVA